jgi:hypothetical protein
VPGLDHEIDRDESLAIGIQWLAEAECEHGGQGTIAMYAKKMVDNAPLLARAATRWEFVSSRSQRSPGRGPVLCVWPPDDRVLELGEYVAVQSALCVIPGSLLDISGWIQKSGAQCLVEGYDTSEAVSLPSDVKKLLDRALFFGGSNGFVGGHEKEHLITRLREIARRSDSPSPEDLADYFRASGETHAKGVTRAEKWYREVLEGKRHRDYRGRLID